MNSFTQKFSQLYGIKIDLKFPTNCPATINDSELTQKFIEYMTNSGNKDNLILNAKPSMGADDFAFYGLQVPSLYLQVGAKGSGTLHSKDLILNEDLLKPALETLAEYIADFK
jgi:metal-dependent amidase/aminoacylase/carboxypeptidase family protein